MRGSITTVNSHYLVIQDLREHGRILVEMNIKELKLKITSLIYLIPMDPLPILLLLF